MSLARSGSGSSPGSPGSGAQEVSLSETHEIQSLFDRFIAAWGRNDARACAAEAIARLYAGYFATMLEGTSTRFARSNLRAADGSAVPDRVVHLVALAQRSGEHWQFLDARAFAFPTIPRAEDCPAPGLVLTSRTSAARLGRGQAR